ncbi:MAG: hypothetical protein Fur0032_08700 [Terrimicrobiaceae bacterium]
MDDFLVYLSDLSMPGCYVVFHKQLGDLLLLQPAIRRLAAEYGSPVRVLTRSGHASLLKLMPGVQYQAGLPLHPHSRLFAFDPLGKTAMRSLLAPAAQKVCLIPDRKEAGPWLRFVYRDILVPGLGAEYVAEYFWRNLPLSDTSTFQPPKLETPPDEWRHQDMDRETPFVMINATSGWRRKSWRADGWAEVIRGLLDAGVRLVCLTSGPSDWQIEHQEKIRVLVADPRVVAYQGLPLSAYLWLCSRASMVLAVDGAGSHLAAAFGVPSVTLFGPTNRTHWHFPGPQSVAIQASPEKDGICRVRTIPAENVLQAALRLLPR